MMKHLVIGFGAGIAAGSVWPLDWTLVGLMALVAAACSLVAKPRPQILIMFLVGFSLAGVRLQFLPQADPALERELGRSVALLGWVSEESSLSEFSTGLVIKDEAGRKFLVRAPLYAPYELGDKLALQGELTKPEKFEVASGREFDYPGWLAVRNIFYEFKRPEIQLVAAADRYPVRRTLLGVKKFLLSRLEAIIPEPQSSLLAGLLLGSKKALGAAWLEEFRRAGVSHMIVLSGYNLTLVAEFLRLLLARLPLWWGVGGAGAAIVAFATMAGGGAAVSRAALMSLIALVARATGRIYDASRALTAAALAMVVWNPRVLIFDLGFQLSVLATLGLLYYAPLVERRLGRVPVRGGLRSVLASTLAAQLAVVPWLLYKTGEFSLVAPLVNPLVLMIVPVIMIIGLAAVLAAMVSVWLAWPAAAALQLLLSYQFAVIHFFAGLPLAALTLARWPLGLTVALYASLGWWYSSSRLIAKLKS